MPAPSKALNPYLAIERGDPGRIGWRIHYFDEIDSTQEAAREMAAAGSDQGTVVIAESQTAGRGRMGRTWHSPAGMNLYATIILRPPIPLADVPRLSLVAGVAAAQALDRVAPNIVALIGININLSASDFPEELRDKATSLRIATGHPCDRIALADSLFNLLDSRYMETLTRGFESVRPMWERYSALTGKRVAILVGDRRESGVVVGIDAGGALLLDIGERVERIVAGEVSVEGAYE